MQTDSHAALAATKNRRSEVTTRVAELAIRASAAALQLETDRAEATALRTVRSAAVGANRPNEVADCDAKLLRKNIAVEISESRATTLRAQHAAGVTELRAAESVVSAAAQEVLDLEMIALANEFTVALDGALAIGSRLEALAGRDHLHIPLNASMPPVPAEVTRALERMPQPNRLDIPMNILRFGNGEAHGGERAQRHAQLVATEEVSA